MGIDADDAIDLFCQHGHTVVSLPEALAAGAGLDGITVGGRGKLQVCGQLSPG
ncbi:hypothetical protein AB0M44_49640 [Streptosporangium subroseum]|uniref:hypothetical protein n=1 Tax=Streptosporangium subroseum TaxID=106412 RepID=UPI0034257639